MSLLKGARMKKEDIGIQEYLDSLTVYSKEKTERVSNRINGLVSLPLDLVERLRDHTEDLRALRDWWATEPRRTYQRD